MRNKFGEVLSMPSLSKMCSRRANKKNLIKTIIKAASSIVRDLATLLMSGGAAAAVFSQEDGRRGFEFS